MDAVASYPLLPSFDGRSYEEIMSGRLHAGWTKAQAQAFFKWYLRQGERAMDRLTSHFSVFDDTPLGLQLTLETAAASPNFVLSRERLAVLIQGHVIPVQENSPVLSSNAVSISFDLGFTFGSFLMRRFPLHYEIKRTRGKIKNLYENLPVITGFPDGVSMNPVKITANAISAYLRGDSARGDLEKLFQTWQESAEGEA